MRPDWQDWALGVAEAVARRGDCTRRKVGCVILDADHRILAAGYNGSAPGGPSCLAGDCPRGRHHQWTTKAGDCTGDFDCEDWQHAAHCEANPVWICRCEKPWPCPDAVAPGSSYDSGPGACHALHAEQNALLWARASVQGGWLVVTAEPCPGCWRMIKASGVAKVTYVDAGGVVTWTKD